MEQILQRLEKVRKSGDGYLACCPVHDDRSPSMTIKDVGDKILMYCFSCGAKGDEIIKALGLPTSVIFKDEGKTDFDKNAYKLEKTRYDDEFFVAVFEKAKRDGELINYADLTRYRLAKSRKELRAEQGRERRTAAPS